VRVADESPDDEQARPEGGTSNVNRGNVDKLVQAGEIHGDVTITAPRDRLFKVSILGVAVLVAVLIVALPRSEPADPQTRPQQAEQVDKVEAPLVVAVQNSSDTCSTEWMTSRSPAEITAVPADVVGWTDWDLVADGTPVRQSWVWLTVQGVGPNSVVINDMKIKVQRAAPLTGTMLSRQCGGPESYRLVDVDLDEPDPRPRAEELTSDALQVARERGWRVDVVQFPYEVSTQDSETFTIRATTEACYCSWTVELSWTSAGRTGTKTIDDGGKPFRTTADGSTTRCFLPLGELTCEAR
jgi:hypothetical protein